MKAPKSVSQKLTRPNKRRPRPGRTTGNTASEYTPQGSIIELYQGMNSNHISIWPEVSDEADALMDANGNRSAFMRMLGRQAVLLETRLDRWAAYGRILVLGSTQSGWTLLDRFTVAWMPDEHRNAWKKKTGV